MSKKYELYIYVNLKSISDLFLKTPFYISCQLLTNQGYSYRTMCFYKADYAARTQFRQHSTD